MGGNVNSMAGVFPTHSEKVYAGPMAVPGPMVTHSNGAVVPKDTPAIATAKANFHQAGGNIKPAKATFHHAGGNVNPMAGVFPTHSKKVYSGPMAVPGPMVTHSNGAVVPKDTPAIATAKAKFHQAGGNIDPSVGGMSVTGMTGVHQGTSMVSGTYAGAVISHSNVGVVPVDTAEVKAAKVAHVAALKQAGTYAHHGMVAHKNGAVVPVEPIDV